MDPTQNQAIIDARAELADAKHDAEAADTAAAAARKVTKNFPFITSGGDEKLAVTKTVGTDHRVILTDDDDVTYLQDENTGLWVAQEEEEE